MKDYEQLYYDELYKNKELVQKIKDLEEELSLIKSYSKNNNLKEIIIKEFQRYKKEEHNDRKII